MIRVYWGPTASMRPCKSSLCSMSLHLGLHFKGSNAFLQTFGGILREPNCLKPPRRWVFTHNWVHSLPGSVGAYQNSVTDSSRALGTHEPLPWIERDEDKGQEKLADRQTVRRRGNSAWNVAADKYFSKQNRTRPDYSSKLSAEEDNEGKKRIVNPYREENKEEISDSEAGNDVRWDGIQKTYEKIVEIDERKRARRSIENNRKAKTYEGRSSWDNQEDWGRRMWREVTSSSPPKMVGEAVYGVGPVMAALTICRREFYALYVQEGLDLSSRNKKKKDKEGIGRVWQMAEKLGLAVKETSKHDLNMLVDSRPHQGLVLDASPLEMVSIKELEPVSKHTDKNSLWVALDEVTDPQNFGAVIRSAYFFGAVGVVVCAKNSAPLSGVVSKASAGCLEVIDVRACRNMMQFLELSASNGWRVLGASASTEALPLNEVATGVPTVLVLGSEGRGLRPLVKRSCSQLVGIPGTLPPIIMKSPDTCSGEEQIQSEDAEVRQSSTVQEFNNFLAVESLNVSVAAGVLLYHLIGPSAHASEILPAK